MKLLVSHSSESWALESWKKVYGFVFVFVQKIAVLCNGVSCTRWRRRWRDGIFSGIGGTLSRSTTRCRSESSHEGLVQLSGLMSCIRKRRRTVAAHTVRRCIVKGRRCCEKFCIRIVPIVLNYKKKKTILRIKISEIRRKNFDETTLDICRIMLVTTVAVKYRRRL